jgi:hypothetical protein
MQHQILFTEPCSLQLDSQLIKELTADLIITDKMYEIIISNQAAEYGDGCGDWAYVFGHLFDLKEYKFVTGHGNDAAQTGLLDLDLIKQGIWFKKRDDSDHWDWDIGDSDDWGCPRLLQRLRKENPSLL